MNILKNYSNFTVLITGATSGIGYEFAKIFARAGFPLVLVSRRREKLEALKEELSRINTSNIHIIEADLSKSDSCQKIFSDTEKNNIQVDILINNAGVGLFGEIIETNEEDTLSMLRLNIESLTGLCILFSKHMAKSKRGFILNIGSVTGFFPIPFFSAYAASKSYVFNYSIALAAELKKYNVHVTCLVPGFTKTNFDARSGITNESFLKFSNSITMLPGKVAWAGTRALFNKKKFYIPGLSNKIVFYLSHALPKGLITRISSFFITKMNKK